MHAYARLGSVYTEIRIRLGSPATLHASMMLLIVQVLFLPSNRTRDNLKLLACLLEAMI